MTLHKLSFEITPHSNPEQLASYGTEFAKWQRAVNWWIGDLARYAEAKWPEHWHQVFPEWISPGLVDRCKAVSKAYPREEDRNPLATWTVHMNHANHPDRLERVQASVEAGRNSDEDRKATQEESGRRWLLAIDVSYYTHRMWNSGAGLDTATGMVKWVEGTVERLKVMGLTDAVCCLDSPTNNRKALTEGWEHGYKAGRKAKDPEFIQQLQLTQDLLRGHGFCCASVDGWEADDLMASYAKQFAGRVTLLVVDKDLKQSLSGKKCNILQDILWNENEMTGESSPEYKWFTEKPEPPARREGETDRELELRTAPSLKADMGLTPREFIEYQCICGDSADNVKGAVGIGDVTASALIKHYGTVEASIQAAKDSDDWLSTMERGKLTPKKQEALIEFEEKLEVTRKLVTLRNDLPLPGNTRV